MRTYLEACSGLLAEAVAALRLEDPAAARALADVLADGGRLTIATDLVPAAGCGSVRLEVADRRGQTYPLMRRELRREVDA